MTGYRPLIRLAIMMLLPAVLSCAWVQGGISPESPEKAPPPAVPSSRTPRQAPAPRVDQARKHMAAGAYQEAIETYRRAFQKQPHDRELASAYVESIETIAAAADRALVRQDFSAAGRNYYLLSKNSEAFKGIDQKLSFNGAQLDARLGECRKALYKQGFQQYREGNLGGAIALWEDLLAIDPQNAEIQKTLRTARLQQKNLQGRE